MNTHGTCKLWLLGFITLMFGIGCCTPNSTGLSPAAVLSVTPLASGTNSCPASTPTATFSQAMNPASIGNASFTLTAAGAAVGGQVTYSASTNTAMFTPAAPLLAGVTYTATITTGATTQFGVAMSANYVWSFTIAANGCNPPPIVTGVTPPTGSLVTCPNGTVTATFNEAMNAATINAANFTLAGPGVTPVAGQVTYNATTHTAVLTPLALLTAGALYTATVSTGVQDLFGNALPTAFAWSFTTAANGCHPPPTVVTIVPTSAATGVCPNAPVVATFSEAMNPATVNAATFTLAPGVVGTVSHDATNTIYTLTPSAALALNAKYTVTISTGVQDTFGNALATAVVSTFTTAANGCNPPPTVLSTTPPNGATGVCPNKVITGTFSEAMNPLTINAATFTLTGPGGAAVAGQVTYAALTNTAIFTPGASLALNSTYTATLTTGAQDLFGNGLAANVTWTFSTGANACLPAAPPIGVTPVNGSTGLCPLTSVAATFGEVMNPATINAATFTLAGPGGALVAGAVTADATDKIFTFKPTAALALSTTYTATITTGAQDTFGNALASNYVWSFTTGASTCSGTVPTVITVSPLGGAVGVCGNTTVTATFSEPMSPPTINAATFTLSNGATGAVTLDGTGTIASYTPSATLALNTAYTAMITTGAKDLNGNALAANYTWTFTTAALACQQDIPLGSAANFEILAGSTVTSTGATVVTGGNLGLSPGSAVTGFPPGVLTAPAVMHLTDAVAAQAQLDLTIAYNDAAGLTGGAALAANLTGLTLTPGLYTNATTVGLPGGNLTLDAQGNANAVFIFQVGTTLTTLSGTQVLLINGAQAKNVFWQVGSSATLGTTSAFQGTIMALQSITLQTGASLVGRALARNAAVTMDTNAVTAP